MKPSNPSRRPGTSGWLSLLLVFASLAFAVTPGSAQQFTTVYSFNANGNSPNGSLVSDRYGNLYGTTSHGGAYSYGSVYKLSPGGVLTTLYSFTNGDDGGNPFSGVIIDQQGNLYGTTIGGGKDDFGTVYKVTPRGTETVLHSFVGGSADGRQPAGGLVADRYGNLYGATLEGLGSFGGGTIYKVTQSGAEKVLYSFPVSKASLFPSSLLIDAQGDLFGTILGGGTNGYGEAFKLYPSGFFRILYDFTSEQDYGGVPLSVIQGNFYFMSSTSPPGDASISGNVYWAAPSGAVAVLYIYPGNAITEGDKQYAGQLGDLYLLGGGTTGNGEIFKVAPGGVVTPLHSFSGGKDGGDPNGGLLADNGGHIFGTTAQGGANGYGTVFKLSLPGAFIGIPGESDCVERSVSELASQYGGTARAARELGYASVEAMYNAVSAYCQCDEK